jgi:osmoprotectant transport system permease protein
VAVPLGFNNSYALAVRSADARDKGITRISDLRQHPELRLGLSQEFLGRADGWPNLARAYGLSFAAPKGLDHGLAYEAIAGGQVDVVDIYTTDAKLDKYQLTVLADDLGYFPRYEAVLLYRADVPGRFPQAWAALEKLQGTLDDAAMRRLNAAAELEGREFGAIASAWLGARPEQGRAAASATASHAPATLWQRLIAPDLGRLALEHVGLVFGALAASCAIGIPLGLLAARRRPTAPLVFGVTGVIQTIPSLALLAFLIPLTGRIGPVPAFIALTLYALLPIVRNTHVGLTQIPREMIQAAKSLGLRPSAIMWNIELPLAMPTLLAGIKTSAVVNVGTATIAAFIGAGGFGERIVTGLALNDQATLLAGAIPVAVLALAIQGGFELLDKRIVPAGLRVRSD